MRMRNMCNRAYEASQNRRCLKRVGKSAWKRASFEERQRERVSEREPKLCPAIAAVNCIKNTVAAVTSQGACCV